MATTPTMFVTGATGALGRLVVEALLETVPKSSIVAGVRDVDIPCDGFDCVRQWWRKRGR